MIEAKLPLSMLLKNNLPLNYITKPMNFGDWYWPLSSLRQSLKPDGN
jgi:hypothetical protein